MTSIWDLANPQLRDITVYEPASIDSKDWLRACNQLGVCSAAMFDAF
jgi:hypothetical protein